MSRHRIKCWPEFFLHIMDGSKPFELRYNDRNYMAGDVLDICEWIPEEGRFSGRIITKRVSYMFDECDFGLLPGYCVLGLEDVI